ncbi:hypothetical protein B0J11DRAFT_561430 [Dendryphion nanum]|uniref:Uncharacterized protein n=1 Tax=Dendryphion nanum TaxID=256645 RepID=A0A9P9IDH5_9PLEO|nr:hypothetical protein B0J11DRAFT_561430 [Dendryphion nanum]
MNGILLALSLGLGLNIASSLRHYSSTLRWAILTRKYVSLGEFDLILGCESLANVFKLMVISLPRSEKLPLTRALSGFERTRNRISQKSTSRYTSILCMSWLLINVGAQVLVAALSLFWPVTPSQAIPLTTRGIVSVANIANFDHLTDIYKVATERASSNTYGITGLEYPVFEYPLNSSKQELAALFRTVIYKRSGGYEYNFLNRNSDQPNAQYLVSPRNISVNTECTPVMTEPTYEMPQNSTVKFRYNGTWYKYPMNSIVSGSISWNVKSNNACGPRCMEIVAYQRADPELGIMTNSMFICNNTVSSIEQIQEFDKLEKEQLKYIYSTDSFARVAAGSIGWTGWRRGNRTVETRVYPLGSATSPTYPVNAGDIENIVSRFTIGAIAAFDDHGPRYNIPNQKNRPVLGLRLNAEWSCILALLGGICGLQLGALTALLAFANKSIIRDESLFSLARLLVPVVSRIPEDEGTNMKGDYIMNHPNLVGQKIRYGYEEEKDGSRKVAISFLFQGMSARSSIRSFPDGMYK